MILAFSSSAACGLFPFGSIHVSWEPAEQVVYGKLAKKKANVISYFLMTVSGIPGWTVLKGTKRQPKSKRGHHCKKNYEYNQSGHLGYRSWIGLPSQFCVCNTHKLL